MTVEEKWKINQEKVAFAKAFPGMTYDWETFRGKVLERVVPLENQKGSLLLFSDGKFTVIPSTPLDPASLLLALKTGRPWLENFHGEAYRTLDELTNRDGELQRKARLEKILSAVKNNYTTIPEIKNALKKLLDELE